MISPFVGGEFKLTSVYGFRQLVGASNFHGGIDLVGVSSKEICAVAPGVVVVSQIVTDRTNATWEWGNYVAVAGDDGCVIYYCHMSERKAKVGERVEIGDVLGIEGNTGYSFGSHLHLEVRDSQNARRNAAEYIGIPNAIGTYKGDGDLKERVEKLEDIVGEVYHNLEQVPNWAFETICKLQERGILKGDAKGDLKLSYQMIRILVMLDRSGAFDAKG